MNALTLMLTAISALEQLIQAGTAASAILLQLKATVTAMQNENRDPTQAEWAALHAQIKAALDDLNS